MILFMVLLCSSKVNVTSRRVEHTPRGHLCIAVGHGIDKDPFAKETSTRVKKDMRNME
jgi:hypothetical protein